MKELQEVVNAKVKAMVEDGSIQAIIEKGVAGALEEAISTQFKSYGAITKQIEDALKNGLRIDAKDLPFDSYNQQMLVAIKSRLGNLFQGAAYERFVSEIDNLLETPPAEMPIQVFVETVVNSWRSDEPWNADDLDNEATVKLEPWMDRDGDYTLKMWKRKSEYSHTSLSRELSADLDLFILNGKIRISHRQVYNPTCFREHEAFIFKLYAAGTVLTGLSDFDPSECDLTLKEEQY